MTAPTHAPPSGPAPLGPVDAPDYRRAPRFAAVLRGLLQPIEQLLGRAYGSRWNPLNKSGPIALALLLMVTVTGIVLLLFYRVGTPYESMVAIQGQVWLGRWMRAFHRYASDLALLFVVYHALRMMVQGRTWGPRVLAWVSGLVLVGMLLIVGWTGFLLVWDSHALIIGKAGARLFDVLPVFSRPISRVFTGTTEVTPAFFFLNLFVHMSVPLAMALLMWIHTARLARAHWLPERRLLWAIGGVLVVLSIVWPAPLDPPADPLALGNRVSLDWFYGFWIPIAETWPPAAVLALMAGLAVAALLVPMWWRPRGAESPAVSRNNELACTGCRQCVMDCPFEAITMVPRTEGTGTPFVARVNPVRCVSCGLCAGSCDQLAIGPLHRGGQDQMRAARTAIQTEPADRVVVLSCTRGELGGAVDLTRLEADGRFKSIGVDCVGALHPMSVRRLLGHFRGVFVAGCAACSSREGGWLANERMFRARHPADEIEVDPARVRLANGGPGDAPLVAAALDRFDGELAALPPASEAAPAAGAAGSGLVQIEDTLVAARARAPKAWRVRRAGLGALVTAASMAGVVWLSGLTAGQTPSHSAVRLAWRLPGQSYRECRALSPQEIAALPQHMRRTEECNTIYLSYRLRASVDGENRVDRLVEPLGARGDRPLFVDLDLPVEPGQRRIEIEFVPESDPEGVGLPLVLRTDIAASSGRAVMVTLDEAGETLITR